MLLTEAINKLTEILAEMGDIEFLKIADVPEGCVIQEGTIELVEIPFVDENGNEFYDFAAAYMDHVCDDNCLPKEESKNKHLTIIKDETKQGE